MSRSRVVVSDVIVDCSDPEALAGFWSAILDRPAGPRTAPYVALDTVADDDIGIGFQHERWSCALRMRRLQRLDK